MTKKKKQEFLELEQRNKILTSNYKDWEADFGFLNLILSRKKGIAKEFLLGLYSKQKASNDYLTDEEIEPVVENIVTEVNSILSSSYKNFLIEKYFGIEENFISFISEDIYVDIVTDTINRNNKKILGNIRLNALNNLTNTNKKDIES